MAAEGTAAAEAIRGKLRGYWARVQRMPSAREDEWVAALVEMERREKALVGDVDYELRTAAETALLWRFAVAQDERQGLEQLKTQEAQNMDRLRRARKRYADAQAAHFVTERALVQARDDAARVVAELRRAGREDLVARVDAEGGGV